MVIPKNVSAAKKRGQAVIASADPEMEQTLTGVLREFWLQPVLSESLEEIRALLAEDDTVMAFSQTHFGDCSFQEVLKAASVPGARVPVIICSEFYNEDFYVQVMSMGAFDYLAFPYSREEVEWVITNALNWGPLLRGTQGRSAACPSARNPS